MRKQITKYLFCFLAFTFFSSAHAAVLNCLDVHNEAELAKYNGQYLNEDWVREIKKTKLIFRAEEKIRKKEQSATYALIVDSQASDKNLRGEGWNNDRILETTWHETWSIPPTGCVEPSGLNKLKYSENGKFKAVYQKVLSKNYLFNMIFNSCYQDEENQKICLKNGAVLIDDKTFSTALKLDQSELAAEGNYLQVSGEDLFWVFVPIPNGWNVYKSDWASSENYKPVDLSKPWKILKTPN